MCDALLSILPNHSFACSAGSELLIWQSSMVTRGDQSIYLVTRKPGLISAASEPKLQFGKLPVCKTTSELPLQSTSELGSGLYHQLRLMG